VLTSGSWRGSRGEPRDLAYLETSARYLLDHPTPLRASPLRPAWARLDSRNDLMLAIADARRREEHVQLDAQDLRTPRPAAPGSRPKGPVADRDPQRQEPQRRGEAGADPDGPENRVDDQMLSVTQQMDQNDDKKSNKDDRKKVTKLDKVDRDLNFKMERLMKRKEQLSNLLSTMEMKFASMAQTAIANMGR
jgi:hypothetical protein